ncbi:Mov34/MPN/PAD-1 family protein [Bacillus sp. BRMEA1]|uniref:Mov34/MPN/PAD-1 family protein n=1 Tax=Neobacillus endophyticus TaxID=2738405 RepID=UPI001566FA12|nr:Mov34/MPN/PAD-1 family protein [Neobacillus endophyticus]NRD81048.1 Mov34/MPN/PAD-1 family protein [Neobacillus endophyticus]
MTKTIEQTDIFSLFGIEDEYSEKKKREEEEMQKSIAEAQKRATANKNSSTTPNSNTSSGGGDKFEVDEQTTIKYFGLEIAITDYFTVEELTDGIPTQKKDGESEMKKVDEESLRKRMEKDFAELVAGMTTMVFIKKKNIVLPIIQAKKKGANLEDCNMEEESKDSSFSTRKIPFSLLAEFISIAKHFSDEHGTEVHGDVYLDFDEEEFFMMIPEQTVHKYWADPTEDSLVTAMKLIDKRFVKVLEIHSHHTMSPFPSSQDDESERSPILYAIVGNIDHFFPEITCRTFSKELDKHIEINPWRVFENPFTKVPTQKYDLSVVEVVK